VATNPDFDLRFESLSFGRWGPTSFKHLIHLSPRQGYMSSGIPNKVFLGARKIVLAAFP